MQNFSQKRIAIVADWLIDFGGAELVISHLLEMFPQADIYTSVCYMEHPMLKGHRVYTSWLQKVPYFNTHHKLAGILRPFAFRSFDLSAYDIIICSSSAESKQVAMGRWNRSLHRNNKKIPNQQNKRQDFSTPTIVSARNDRNSKLGTLNFELGTRKSQIFVYCHTPTRYYWSHAKEYEDMMEFGWFNPLVKAVFRLVKGWMQRVDYAAAQRVDYIIANSRTTQERIRKYYNRDSVVIYPGVEEIQDSKGKIQNDMSHNLESRILNLESQYYLGLGRCIPYKRFDLLVDAFNQNGRKLILCTATDTPIFRELRARSKENIEWKFAVNDHEKYKLITRAKGLFFPPEEDFGLVPVESMALGTPVIAYEKGGATESVIDGKTGVFFSPQTPEALNEAIGRFEKMHFDRGIIRNHAEQFSKETFQKNLLKHITSTLGIDTR